MVTKITRSKFWIFFFLTASVLSAQQQKITGRIYNVKSGDGLSFANIRVAGTNKGTAANLYGEYELTLKEGEHTLIASYIGYSSDTVKVTIPAGKRVNFYLAPETLELSEIVVFPGENPALRVIREAIAARERREDKLKSYVFEAFTKGTVWTTEEISAKSSSVNLGIGTKKELKITGVFENISKGYYKAPGDYREEITAQKQTANFPSTVNILTGGRIIQNFYSEEISFFGSPLTGPLADNSIDYYDFILGDITVMNEKPVYRVDFETKDNNDPGFGGSLFIEGGSYGLIKADVYLNKMANPGGIFDEIRIFQQFRRYEEDIFMPVDYRLYVEGNPLGLAKFAFQVESVMSDYEINAGTDEDKFGYTVLKVLPGADKKGKDYWDSVQSLPASEAEIAAWKRIDSLESVPVSFWDRFSPLSDRLPLSDHVYLGNPLYLYKFNKTEGHALQLGAGINDALEKRFNAEANFSYGFADEQFKSSIEAEYLFGEYRTGRAKLNVYDRLDVLFGSSVGYNRFTSTVLSLFSHYDFRDYYYSEGADFSVSDYVLPYLRLGAKYAVRSDKFAGVNTDYSFFYRDRTYEENTRILNADTRSGGFFFKLDFRKYIEDGYFRRKVGGGDNIFIEGGVEFGKASHPLISEGFTRYNGAVYGYYSVFRSTGISFRAETEFIDGEIPLQLMNALPGNINSSGKRYSFRTLGIGEAFGDRITALYLNYDLNDELFRALGIPGLESSRIGLNIYFNGGWVKMTDKNKALVPELKTYTGPPENTPVTEYLTPLYELGFGVGHPLFPLNFEFTWRLNHRSKNSFSFGVNSGIL